MAIGGYTTAVLSRDHHMNLILTMLVAFAICFLCGAPRRTPGAPALGRVPRARDLRVRGFSPQIPLKFSTYLGGSGGVQSAKDGEPPLAVRSELGGRCDPVRGRLARPARANRDGHSARFATARWRRRRPASRCRSTRRSPSASRRRSPASPARSSCSERTASRSRASSASSSRSRSSSAPPSRASARSGASSVGAVFVGLLPEISSSVPVIGSTHGQDVVFGLIVIAIMVLLPTGVAGLLLRLRRLAREGLTRGSIFLSNRIPQRHTP